MQRESTSFLFRSSLARPPVSLKTNLVRILRRVAAATRGNEEIHGARVEMTRRISDVFSAGERNVRFVHAPRDTRTERDVFQSENIDLHIFQRCKRVIKQKEKGKKERLFGTLFPCRVILKILVEEKKRNELGFVSSVFLLSLFLANASFCITSRVTRSRDKRARNKISD